MKRVSANQAHVVQRRLPAEVKGNPNVDIVVFGRDALFEKGYVRLVEPGAEALSGMRIAENFEKYFAAANLFFGITVFGFP